MKKSIWIPVLFFLLLSLGGSSALAQRGGAGVRINQGLGRQVNRFPNQRRLPPIVGPQFGRRPGIPRNQEKKRLIQQRLMQAIGLTPDQHARMQEIRRGHDDEVIAAGRRLRQARRSLDLAIMSERYDEAAVRRATEELAAAQADKVKLDSRIRAEVRGVLTPEQVIRFHQLERQMRQELRQQNLQDRERDQEDSQPTTKPPLESANDDPLDFLSSLNQSR
jgi:Spy/CpxP family protein refolding chaperone